MTDNLSNRDKVKILSEALPYIQKFCNKAIVIKYGGSAMTEERLKHSFARDIVLLKAVGMHPVIVHGGGSSISANLKAAGIKSKFFHGLRVTDKASIDIIAETLGTINISIAQYIKEHEGAAQSIIADGLIKATKLETVEGISERIDLGMVGEVSDISAEFGELVCNPTHIPVVSPLGIGSEGECYNINADWVASSIARHLKAEKLILMTNTEGLLDGHGQLIVEAPSTEISKLIEQEIIHSGMLPKVACALKAIGQGAESAHIIDGRTSHAVLLELLTDGGVGTLIKH